MMISFSRIAVRRLQPIATAALARRPAFSTSVAATSDEISFTATAAVENDAPVVAIDLESLLAQTYPTLLEKAAAATDDDTAAPTYYTPGHVLAVLNQVGKGGVENIITEDHFRFLIQTARPYEVKDAQVLLTALTNYKRINGFVLTEQLATECIQSILKTSDPTRGGLLLLQHFTRESGLYFSTNLDCVHQILRHVLHESSVLDENAETAEATWTALSAFWDQLLIRYSRPDRTDKKTKKKRAKRKYLRELQITHHEGPTLETMELAVEIGLALKEPEEVYQTIVQPCLDSERPIRLEMNDGGILSELNARRMAERHNNIAEADDELTI